MGLSHLTQDGRPALLVRDGLRRRDVRRSVAGETGPLRGRFRGEAGMGRGLVLGKKYLIFIYIYHGFIPIYYYYYYYYYDWV